MQLAVERIDAWADVRSPSVGGERGGSSSPREVEDRQEARRLAVQVARDRNRLPLLLAQIEDAAGLEIVSGPVVSRLERVLRRVKLGVGLDDGLVKWTGDLKVMVARYTESPAREAGKLPSDDVVPGCVSCARVSYRKSVKVGGHFAPVYEKAKKHKLCRNCYDGSEIVGGVVLSLPAIEYCDIMHRQSASAAGRWLARRKRHVA